MSRDSGFDREADLALDDMTTPVSTVRSKRTSSIAPGSSSKRSLFRDEIILPKKDNMEYSTSDVESDLGPMSPLALTDASSCDSSPGRQFISPFNTPEKSPSKWDRLGPGCRASKSPGGISPFKALRRITKAARSSPRKVLFIGSPRSRCSSQNTLTEDTFAENMYTSNEDLSVMQDEEIVPETPRKDGCPNNSDDENSCVEETPQKEEENLEGKVHLNTPLGSISKNDFPLPRVSHRRKSLGNLDNNNDENSSSPEIKRCPFKRHLQQDSSDLQSLLMKAKYQKTDDFSSIPRARAALFQEKKILDEPITSKRKEFVLTTKSFYGSAGVESDSTIFSRRSLDYNWRPSTGTQKTKKPSPPTSNRRSMGKKSRKGQVNMGVRHGIRKPRPKRPAPILMQKPDKPETKENLNPKIKSAIDKIKEHSRVTVGSNNKFFKTSNLDKKEAEDTEQANKRARMDIFDTTDLTVDEPAVEEVIEQNKANILKVIEQDWADDYEDFENDQNLQIVAPMQNSNYRMPTLPLSPKKSNIMLNNVIMSPASELVNMASTMNLKDDNPAVGDISKKFFPLFSKGYTPAALVEDPTSRKRKRTTNAWQLSSRFGKTDNQYQIDAGQKLFGATQCQDCGIVYYVGDPEDESAHLNYHNSTRILKFPGWKNERIIFKDTFTSSRIIVIEPNDSNVYWKKVSEILEVVDRDLGLSDMKLSFYRDKKIYLYIRDKTILGVLVPESVTTANKMIPELADLNCCTAETTPVKCGINVVWTTMSHRRQGIATKLVDTFRINYFYGYILSIEDIAFSTPTPSGKAFAEKYTKTRNFKVYS